MKKSFIISFIFIIFSAVLLTACGKPTVKVSIVETTGTQIVLIYTDNQGLDSTDSYYKYIKGKKSKIYVSVVEGYNPENLKLYLNDTEVALTKDTSQSGSSVQSYYAYLTISEETVIKASDLSKFVYSISLPVDSVNKFYYTVNNSVINPDNGAIPVIHGEDVYIKITPKTKEYSVPDALFYVKNSTTYLYAEERPSGTSNDYGRCNLQTDMFLNPIKAGVNDRSKTFVFANVSQNIALSFFENEVDDKKTDKKLDIAHAQNKLYSILYMIEEGANNALTTVLGQGEEAGLAGQDVYVNLSFPSDFREFLKDDYKNDGFPTLLVNGVEYSVLGNDEPHAGNYKIPASETFNSLKIEIKENLLKEKSAVSGTFVNEVKYGGVYLELVHSYDSYRHPLYLHDGKVYATNYSDRKGAVLTVEAKYIDKIIVTDESSSPATITYEDIYTGEGDDSVLIHREYRFTNLSENFKIHAKAKPSTVSIPYDSLKNSFKVEYKIGKDLTAPFVEVTSKTQAESITVDNFDVFTIKLTPFDTQVSWVVFELSEIFSSVNNGTEMAMSDLYRIEGYFSSNIKLPDETSYYYVLLAIDGNLEITLLGY